MLGAPSNGKAEYLQRLPTFLATFPGVRYDVEDVTTEGNKVAAAYTMRATYEGTPFEIRGLMRIFVRDGLIERRVDYWDGLSFLRQTGQA